MKMGGREGIWNSKLNNSNIKIILTSEENNKKKKLLYTIYIHTHIYIVQLAFLDLY